MFPRLNGRTCRGLAALGVALISLTALPARAEGQLRIAEQFGIVYLLLNVAQDQGLIEKQGKAQGIDIKVEFVKLSGGAAVNEASLGNFPYYLTSINPAVKTIADFSDKDRIALPAVGVSVQSRILQLASARQWGDAQYNKLDKLQVAVPHPEATAAIVKGGTEITAHFGNPPFQEQGLAGNPNAHIVLSSYQVLGGPASATVLYATEKYRRDNPKTYKAFVDALAEAAKLVKADPEKAADIFIRTNKSGIDRALLLKIIKNPEVEFKLAPQNTFALAEFMHRVGAIKNKPTRALDYFFDDAQNAAAN
jgi:NitT/TauT family transport system substrate-binding protein